MNENQMDNRAMGRRLFGGFLVGIAFLVPGISGGALAATLGYFEPAIAAVSEFSKAPKKNFQYLLPLVIGGAAGAFMVAVLLSRLMDVAETQAICFFVGMLAGTLPKLWRSSQPDRPAPKHWLLMLAGLAVTAVLFFMDDSPGEHAYVAMTLPIALAGGGIFGAGAVVPGISGSFFLIYLGWYRPIIDAVVRFDIPIILALGAGFVVVVLLLVKVAHWLFRNRRRATYSVIIGFVVGSLALVFPADFFASLWWVNVLLVAAGFATGLALGRMERVK